MVIWIIKTCRFLNKSYKLMTFQGTNQALLWMYYSIIAHYTISYTFLHIATTGQWVLSVFCESILILHSHQNHYNKLHHLLPAWLETQIQRGKKTHKPLHLKKPQPSTFYLFSRAQAVGQGIQRKVSWYTSQHHSCLCMCCTEKYRPDSTGDLQVLLQCKMPHKWQG